MTENYGDFEKGDQVVVFSYTNTKPDYVGEIEELSEHFAGVRQQGKVWGIEWVSRAKIEKIQR